MEKKSKPEAAKTREDKTVAHLLGLSLSSGSATKTRRQVGTGRSQSLAIRGSGANSTGTDLTGWVLPEKDDGGVKSMAVDSEAQSDETKEIKAEAKSEAKPVKETKPAIHFPPQPDANERIPLMPRQLLHIGPPERDDNMGEMVRYLESAQRLCVTALNGRPTVTAAWCRDTASTLMRWICARYVFHFHMEFGMGSARTKVNVSLPTLCFQTRLLLLSASKMIQGDPSWTGSPLESQQDSMEAARKRMAEWTKLWIWSLPEHTIAFWDAESEAMDKTLCLLTVRRNMVATVETNKLLEEATRHCYWLHTQLGLIKDRLKEPPAIYPEMRAALKEFMDDVMSIDPMSEWHTSFMMAMYRHYMPGALRFQFRQKMESASEYRPPGAREASLPIVMKTVMPDAIMKDVHRALDKVELAKLYKDPTHELWGMLLLRLFGERMETMPYKLSFFDQYVIDNYHFADRVPLVQTKHRTQGDTRERGPMMVSLLGRWYVAQGIDTLYPCKSMVDLILVWLIALRRHSGGKLEDGRECMIPLIQRTVGLEERGNERESLDGVSLPMPREADDESLSMPKDIDEDL